MLPFLSKLATKHWTYSTTPCVPIHKATCKVTTLNGKQHTHFKKERRKSICILHVRLNGCQRCFEEIKEVWFSSIKKTILILIFMKPFSYTTSHNPHHLVYPITGFLSYYLPFSHFIFITHILPCIFML